MPAQVSFVQESVDRFNDAYRSLDEGVQRVQKEIASRRKSLEKQLATSRRNLEKQVTNRRRSLEKRTRQQVDQLLKSEPAVRVRSFRSEAVRQLESGVDTLLSYLQIASKSDLRRIDRKVGQINRKLKDLEGRRRANGSAPRT